MTYWPITIARTAEAGTATNQLSILVHLPCTSRTSIRPITADAIRTEIIIATSVVGRHQWTTPKWGSGWWPLNDHVSEMSLEKIAPLSDDPIAHRHRSTREDNHAQQADLLFKVSDRRG